MTPPPIVLAPRPAPETMLRPGRIARLAFLALFLAPAAATTSNFLKCLTSFKEHNITVGGTDYDGTPVTNPLDAVGLTYTACVQHCNLKREPFDWTRFSQEFSAWLIPWLALISQLPFGAKNRLDNLISGELPCSVCRFVVLIFSPHHHSRPHRRVSHPRSILTRSDSHQYSLGQQSLLRHQVPQPQERRQGSHLPPTGPTPSDHPRRPSRVAHSPPRER